MLINNRIINKIKKQYKRAAYIDKNGNKNTNISLDANNKAFTIAEDAIQLIHNLANDYLIDKHFTINLSKYKHNTYFNNTPLGICGDSFVNRNGDKIDIEFHVKQFDSNIKKQILQQFKKTYKYQLNIISQTTLININQQLEQFITNNFYFGVIMVFINNKYVISQGQLLKRKQKNQLRTIGLQLINEYKQRYS